jgi:hypothetical protein
MYCGPCSAHHSRVNSPNRVALASSKACQWSFHLRQRPKRRPRRSSPAMEPVSVTVEVQNLGDDQLVVPLRRIHERDFILVVHDARGEAVPMTRHGGDAYRRPPVDSVGVFGARVKRGQPLRASLVVNRLYDLTIPGKYSVTAFCFVYQRNGQKLIRIESDPLEITVRPNLYAPPSGPGKTKGE